MFQYYLEYKMYNKEVLLLTCSHFGPGLFQHFEVSTWILENMFAALCTADFELAASIFVRNLRNFKSEFLKKNASKF